jgi:hypothetical protein
MVDVNVAIMKRKATKVDALKEWELWKNKSNYILGGGRMVVKIIRWHISIDVDNSSTTRINPQANCRMEF